VDKDWLAVTSLLPCVGLACNGEGTLHRQVLKNFVLSLEKQQEWCN
jgi:hypothetical protein